jgi:hypothetical protein
MLQKITVPFRNIFLKLGQWLTARRSRSAPCSAPGTETLPRSQRARSSDEIGGSIACSRVVNKM